MTLQVINNGSADNDGTGDDIRTAFQKAIDNFAELYSLAYRTRFKFISALADLPAAISAVHTLPAGSYFFTDNIDLLGGRLFLDGVVNIRGTSSETASITSTGLTGAALITTTNTLPIADIALTAPAGATLISALAGSATDAIDWRAVNIINTPSIGTISGYSNCIFTDGLIGNSAGLTFDGAIGTIAFNTYAMTFSAGTGITLPATLTVTRRFRIVYSSLIATGGITAINVNVAATIPDDSYILDTVNFSGGGTYTAGVQYNDNKARFVNNKGVTNSSTLGYMTMLGNGTATVIGGIATPAKMAGTFSLNAASERFVLVGNKLKYTGSPPLKVMITIVSSCTTTANNQVDLYAYKNAGQIAASIASSTATAAGRSENIKSGSVTTMVQNDEFDPWVANATAGNNITGVNCIMIIEPVGV